MFFFCYYIYSRINNLIKNEKQTFFYCFYFSIISTILLLFAEYCINYNWAIEHFSKIVYNLHILKYSSEFILFNLVSICLLSFRFFVWFFFYKKELKELQKNQSQEHELGGHKSRKKKLRGKKFKEQKLKEQKLKEQKNKKTKKRDDRSDIFLLLNIVTFLFLFFWHFFILIFDDIVKTYKIIFILFLVFLYLLSILLIHYYTGFKYYKFLWNTNLKIEKRLRFFRQCVLSLYYLIIFFILNYCYNIVFKILFPHVLWNFWQLYFLKYITSFDNYGVLILILVYFFLFFLLSLIYFFSTLCIIKIISSFIITIFFDDFFYRRYDKYWFDLEFKKSNNLFFKSKNIKTNKILKQPLFSRRFYLFLFFGIFGIFFFIWFSVKIWKLLNIIFTFFFDF